MGFIKKIKHEIKRISWPDKKSLLKDLVFFTISLSIITLFILSLDSLFNFIVLKISELL